MKVDGLPDKTPVGLIFKYDDTSFSVKGIQLKNRIWIQTKYGYLKGIDLNNRTLSISTDLLETFDDFLIEGDIHGHVSFKNELLTVKAFYLNKEENRRVVSKELEIRNVRP